MLIDPAKLEREYFERRPDVGNPEQMRAQIQPYADAGVEELMLQWFDLDDIDGLRAFATSVLPHL